MHRDTVIGGPGLEPVGQRQFEIAGLPGVRVVRAVFRPQQIVTGEGKQVRCLVPLLLPPRVEVARGDDVGRDAGVVEGVDVVVTDQKVTPTGPLLDLLEFSTQPGVVAEEVVPGLPVPLDQRVPDEQLAAQFRFDLGVADLAAGNEWQTVQRHPLVGDHLAASGLPVWLAVGALHQMTGDPLDRLGFDFRGDPAEQSTGLHQVGHHDPARWLLGQHRAGRQHELGVAGALIVAALALTQPDVREQARGERGVDGGRLGGLVTLADTDVTGDAA